MNDIRIIPTTSSLGAEIEGIDLSMATDEQLEIVRWALLEHHVVFLRDQRLDDEAHEQFARRWGDPIPNPILAHLDAPVAIGVVFNDAEHLPDQDGEGWHTDHSWASYIPDVAILRAVTTPPRGGDTMWSNIGAAHDALSPALQEFLADATARHDPGERFAHEMRARMPAETADELLAAFPGFDHPVIVRHPVTGRRGLFVNPGYTRRINGLHASESAALLRLLFDLVAHPDLVCRFRWRDGDVAIWDEHATLHRGPNDFAPARRELRRFTVGASEPAPV
ncbi:MAG: TauD/TfdA family dioxygenase [Acidimicrobiales bacterium]